MKTKASIQTNLYKLVLIGQKVAKIPIIIFRIGCVIREHEESSLNFLKIIEIRYYSNQIYRGNEEKEEAFKEKLFGKIGFECLLELLS